MLNASNLAIYYFAIDFYLNLILIDSIDEPIIFGLHNVENFFKCSFIFYHIIAMMLIHSFYRYFHVLLRAENNDPGIDIFLPDLPDCLQSVFSAILFAVTGMPNVPEVEVYSTTF